MLGYLLALFVTSTGALECRPNGGLVRLADLAEASGVAVSRDGSRLWTHNDSGDPVIVELTADGRVTRRITLAGAAVEDWEAIAAGPCPGGSCVYIGDIGDNDASRKSITIYRVPEGALGKASAQARDVLRATYPDGAHDAETLLVEPQTGILYIVTKGDTGPVALYRFPRDVHPGKTAKLERIGTPRDAGKADRITDGSVSPDGRWVVLRSNGTAYVYGAADFFAGRWRETTRVDLGGLGEPQGEGIAFAGPSTLILLGEGGGKKQPGTFARLSCTFD